MFAEHNKMTSRFEANAGIALGPILFIIAILAILAAAIAAGSGSFNASTGSEGNKAKASALIQIGENLKIGMDRLSMENGVAYNGWTTAPANTSANVDLFSPTGGGIAAPSVAMAGNPASDVWYYPQIGIPNLGTYTSNTSNTVQVAVLNVPAGVCAEVNYRANGTSNAPVQKALGNFAVLASQAQGTLAANANTNWPVAADGVNLAGKPVGCVGNSNTGTGAAGYFFYQVLYVQ